MLPAEPEVSGREEQDSPGMEEQDGYPKAAKSLPHLQLSGVQTEGKDPKRERKGGHHLSQVCCEVHQEELGQS